MTKKTSQPTFVQTDLFGGPDVAISSVPKKVAPSPQKRVFNPPSLIHALEPGKIKDHGMLWVRMLAKSNRTVPLMYLYAQVAEMKTKRTEYDDNVVMRTLMMHAFLKTFAQ